MKKAFQVTVYIFAIIGFGLVSMYLAVRFGLTNDKGIVDKQRDFYKNQMNSGAVFNSSDNSWQKSEEWQILEEAIVKDKAEIDRASTVTGIPSRLIVANLVVEQLRLFTSNREIFKSIFAPLKMLGDQSQFSWGVMGIKQDTAREIENNLKDSSSPFYLGDQMANILDYSSSTLTSTNNFKNNLIDTDSERFSRLTNEHNRYYSYLYSAILIKEIENQWQKAGFPINDRPEIIATLYNIGFANSKPNANPDVGGAEIEINGVKYSFGGLAGSFYYSDQLTEQFPR